MNDREDMAALLAELAANRVTQYSPSPYETGQYLRVSSRREGAAKQVEYLLTSQRPDGLWGAPGYELIPTFGAIAGLAALPGEDARVGEALTRACRKLWELALSADGLRPLPDTVASELIAPALIDLTRDVLGRYRPAGAPEFPYPPRARPEFWRKLHDQVTGGGAIPKKIWHSLEVFHPLPEAFAQTVKAAPDGAVTCSPAATAAWLSVVGGETGRGSLPYLREVETRYDGAIPMGSSMPYFELLWILNLALKYFPDVPIPRSLLDELADAFTDAGIGGGPGLPPDGDDTAYTLLAWEKLGTATDPEVLMAFWEDDHFISYPAEQTPSETVNAHAVEYLTHLRKHRGIEKYADIEDTCLDWLIAQQTADGCWYDKWHISPYYSTAASVEALIGSGRTTSAIDRARTFLLERQTADGGWGLLGTTREETAYAVLALDFLAGRDADRPDEEAAKAIKLAGGLLAEPGGTQPPLWMGKDLYTPFRIVSTVELCGRAVAAEY